LQLRRELLAESRSKAPSPFDELDARTEFPPELRRRAITDEQAVTPD
jgi:hypothetical protein